MTITAKYLEEKGYTLRSGGAMGSDFCFEIGSKHPDIYVVNDKHLPKSKHKGIVPDLEKYRHVVKQCCLHYNKIRDQYARDLHTRNICQVIGHDPDNIIKSDFLICYTDHGEYVGGTTTAIRCAERFDIPIFNFGKYERMTDEEIKIKLKEFLQENMK